MKKDLTEEEKDRVLEVYRQVVEEFDITPYYLYQNTGISYMHAVGTRTRKQNKLGQQLKCIAYAYKIVKSLSPAHPLLPEMESVLKMHKGPYVVVYTVDKDAREQDIDLYQTDNALKLPDKPVFKYYRPYKPNGLNFKSLTSTLIKECLITQEQSDAVHQAFLNKECVTIDHEGNIVA